MPFVAVDTERHVDFDVLDTTRPALFFPWELVICCPGRTHAQECGVGNGLCVGSDAIMFFGGKVDECGLEAGEDAGNEGQRFI